MFWECLLWFSICCIWLINDCGIDMFNDKSNYMMLLLCEVVNIDNASLAVLSFMQLFLNTMLSMIILLWKAFINNYPPVSYTYYINNLYSYLIRWQIQKSQVKFLHWHAKVAGKELTTCILYVIKGSINTEM